MRDSKPRKLTMPRWLGPIIWVVGIPFFHGVIPYWISLLGIRHGWAEGRPGAWNLLGLVLVAAGAAVITWTLVLHFVKAPEGWELEATPKYLLMRGPYRYSRNPIYLSYGLVWPGWAAFYGSVAILVPLVLLWPVGVFVIVPREERGLEARFGESYRHYKQAVPRWLGRPARN